MDSRQQRPQRKTLQWQLAQEQRQQSPQQGLSVASSQPDTKSKPPEDLQTQDWEVTVKGSVKDGSGFYGARNHRVCEPQEHRRPGTSWNVSIDERRHLAMLHMEERTNPARDPFRNVLGLHLEDQQTEPSPLSQPVPDLSFQAGENVVRDITQLVAEMMSEGIERDVLLPHPLRPTEYSNALQDFLARNAPPLEE